MFHLAVASVPVLAVGYYFYPRKKNYNSITIFQKQKGFINMIVENNSINLNTFSEFTSAYNLADKTKPIEIVVDTPGGAAACAEAICNVLFDHVTSETHCVINNYAFSGGAYLALSCDKIIMSKSAIMGPADAQIVINNSSFPISSVIHSIEDKLHKNQPVKEIWYSAYLDSLKAMERQKLFFDKLRKKCLYSEEVYDKIYDEFFSGKYNHDQVFTVNDLISMGLRIEIKK